MLEFDPDLTILDKAFIGFCVFALVAFGALVTLGIQEAMHWLNG